MFGNLFPNMGWVSLQTETAHPMVGNPYVFANHAQQRCLLRGQGFRDYGSRDYGFKGHGFKGQGV